MTFEVLYVSRCPPFHEKLVTTCVLLSSLFLLYVVITVFWRSYLRFILKRQNNTKRFRWPLILGGFLLLSSAAVSWYSIASTFRLNEQLIGNMEIQKSLEASSAAWSVFYGMKYLLAEVPLAIGLPAFALLLMAVFNEFINKIQAN